MAADRAFTATFDRDHSHITVAISGDFAATDLERLQAEFAAASRGRPREWTIDAAGLRQADASLVDGLLWIRSELGHVCLLNPPADLSERITEVGADHQIVVRSDSRR